MRLLWMLISEKKMSLLTILFMIGLFSPPAIYAQKTSSGYQIVDLSKDLSTIARIVNGIALSQGLDDRSVDVKEVVRELLNLKAGVTLDDLEKENVAGLADDLAGLSSTIEKECGENGSPCGSLKIISNGITGLESVVNLPSGNYEDVLKDGSTLQVLSYVKTSAADLLSIKKNVNGSIFILDDIVKGTSFDVEQQIMTGYLINNYVNTTVEIYKKMAKKFSQQQIDALDVNKLKTSVDFILQLGSISSAIESKSGFGNDVLNAKLSGILKVMAAAEPTLSDGNFQKKLKILSGSLPGVKLLPNEKLTTSGFFNGAKDLKQLLTDVKSTFVKELILNGTSSSLLDKMFSPVVTLSKQVEPLETTLSAANTPELFDSFLMLEKQIDLSREEIDRLKPFHSLSECVSKLHSLEKSNDIGSWKTERKLVEALASDAKTYAEKISSVSIDVTVLDKFLKSINADVHNRFDELKGYKDIDKVITELKNMRTKLDSFITPNFATWAEKSKADKLVPVTRQWLKDNKLDSISQCLNNKKMLTEAKQAIGNRDSLTALLSLKSDNKHLIEVSKAATSQKATIDAWNNFKKTQKVRTTRAVNSDGRLKDAFNLTQKFSAAVKLFRDLATSHSSMADIQELIKAEKVIDDTINKSKDDKLKSEMAKVWNADTKTTLKNLQPLIDSLNQKINTKPERLAEFVRFLKLGLNFDGMVDLHMRILASFLELLNASNPNRKVTKKMMEFEDMLYANGRKSLAEGYESFMLIMTFFISLPSVRKYMSRDDFATTILSISAEKESYIWAIIVGAIVLVVILVASAIVVYCWCFASRKISPDKQKKLNCMARLKQNIDFLIEKLKKKREPDEEPSDENQKDKTKPAQSKPDKPEPVPMPLGPPPPEKPLPAPTSDDMKTRHIFDDDNNNIQVVIDENKNEDEMSYIGNVPKKTPKPVKKQRTLNAKVMATTAAIKKHERNQEKIQRQFSAPAPNAKLVQYKEIALEALQAVKDTKFENTKLPEGNKGPSYKYHMPKTDFYIFGDQIHIENDEQIPDKQNEQLNTVRTEEFAAEAKMERPPTEEKANELDMKVRKESEKLQNVPPTPNPDDSDMRTAASGNGEGPSDDPSNRQPNESEDQPSDVTSEPLSNSNYEIEGDIKRIGMTSEELDKLFSETLELMNKDTRARLKILEKENYDSQPFYLKFLINFSKLLSYASNDQEVLYGVLKKYTKDKSKGTEIELEEGNRFESGTDSKMKLDMKSAMNENTLLYFSERCVKEDGTIDEVQMMFEMMKKRYLKKGASKKGEFPIPFPWLMQLVDITKNLIKSDALLILNRKKTLVVGDIRGSYLDLLHALNQKLTDGDCSYVFLGNYVVGGKMNIETIVMLMLMKILNPEKFHMLRGNRELVNVNWESFVAECRESLGEIEGEDFFVAVNELFELFPLSCILNYNILCTHGGVSSLMTSREEIERLLKKKPKTHDELKMFMDVLYSAPVSIYSMDPKLHEAFIPRGEHVHDYTFAGHAAVLRDCGFTQTFKGHTAYKNGYWPHFGRRCITLYSFTNHINNNASGMALVHDDGKVEFIRTKDLKPKQGGDQSIKKTSRSKDSKNSKDSKGSKSSKDNKNSKVSKDSHGDKRTRAKKTKRKNPRSNSTDKNRCKNNRAPISERDDSGNNAVLLDN